MPTGTRNKNSNIWGHAAYCLGIFESNSVWSASLILTMPWNDHGMDEPVFPRGFQNSIWADFESLSRGFSVFREVFRVINTYKRCLLPTLFSPVFAEFSTRTTSHRSCPCCNSHETGVQDCSCAVRGCFLHCMLHDLRCVMSSTFKASFIKTPLLTHHWRAAPVSSRVGKLPSCQISHPSDHHLPQPAVPPSPAHWCIYLRTVIVNDRQIDRFMNWSFHHFARHRNCALSRTSPNHHVTVSFALTCFEACQTMIIYIRSTRPHQFNSGVSFVLVLFRPEGNKAWNP